MANAIATENLNIGTTAWQPANVATTEIQAYCDAVAYNAGDTVTLYCSTQVASTTYTLKIFRMGWYFGSGGCLKSTASGRVGVAQGYWNASNSTLTNCPTAIINSTTHLTEAGWASTDTWAIPSNACTGVYLAQFVDANSKMTFCTFVVRGLGTEDYAYIRPVTTDQAYNDWGGYSLYTTTPAVKVSFNRPNTQTYGTGFLLALEVQMIKWMESQGYSISYLTSVDIHANATQIQNYKAMISGGHDEYWSREMRDGVEAALASGIGLGFMGANVCYWQIRFEVDNASHANRTITCYKVLASGGPAYATDPFYGVDNTRVTSLWRDALINRPENTLVGIMYSSFLPGNNQLWTIDASATSQYLLGTGFVAGTSYGIDIVGHEYDKIFSGSPSGLQTIATTSVLNSSSQADTQNTTTYVAPSGALVFASGSHCLSFGLDGYRQTDIGIPHEIRGMQLFFTNIMQGLVANKTPRVKQFSGFMAHV